MNPVVLTIKDTTNTGKVFNEIDVSFNTSHVTVKEIIEARVTAEVEKYNEKRPGYFNGLIQPSQAEKTLNGYKMKDRKKVDAEKQVYIALDAFLKNGFFILIDTYQAESLEQEIEISPTTQINFLKLTPLIGG